MKDVEKMVMVDCGWLEEIYIHMLFSKKYLDAKNLQLGKRNLDEAMESIKLMMIETECRTNDYFELLSLEDNKET